jgi:lipoprotein-releasing system permease protein
VFRPLELFIGLRYTRAKRRNHFISFISLSSMLGIAVGVTALITVLSVMNGFEKELRARMLGMISHATITGIGEDFRDWPRAVEQSLKHPHVVGAAPYVEREAMLQGARVSGALLRGITPEREGSVSELIERMAPDTIGSLKPGAFNIVLGSELAAFLGVNVGDQITVYAPQLNVTPAGVLPTLKRFTVTGTFSAGMNQYDRGLAVIHLEDAQRLYRMGEGVTGVRLKLDDLFRGRTVARELADQFGDFFSVRDWTQENANFFAAVQMEKTVMFVILLLIVAVAAFNIISTLIMVVTDKQADIAILRTLGLSPRAVMGVFIVQGTIIGAVGTVLGVVGGVLLALNVENLVPALEKLLGRQFLSADIYYISELPSDLLWSDVFTIALSSFVLCTLATIYPALRAAATQPAEALRYE